jgi:hypothetical protein
MPKARIAIALDRTRRARECAKLDPAVEQATADEGLGLDEAEWPAA